MSTPPTIIIEPGINEVPMPMPVSDVATGTSVDGCMAEGQETEPQVPQPRPTRKRGLRYKMKYVEWNIKRLCDYDFGRCSYIISRVRETLDKLFKYYESTTSGPSTSFMDSRGCAGETEIPSTGLDMYSVLKLERSRAYEDDMMAEESYVNKSELDMYLLERFDTTVKELDVLLWWKPIQLREMLMELEKYEEIAQDLDAAVEAGEDV
ncbi:hypothetical protein POM88_001495 [Heracleum sosnowskyi]|uniref:Uncharacterized protein n=1 Tax=Heracleum sosnowskyi TaxID=360622 RepID=A0AAD8JG83_9APIA|nr:hypothetical protein POM88_001495 [Heracleum sosnowskyi]